MNLLLTSLAQTDDPQMLGQAVILAGGLSVVLVMAARGRLSRSAWADSPARPGRLGVTDLGLAIVLFFAGTLGMSLAGMNLGLLDPDDTRPAGRLALMLFSQAGMLPAVFYALVRGGRATRGGLAGLGLGWGRRAGLTWKMLLLGCPAGIVLTLATMVAVTGLLRLIGYTPPAIAHDALRAMLESRRPEIWLGLVLSAVVVAPLVEEILFRAFLQTALLQGDLVPGRWTAIAAASALFTAIHLGAETWHVLPVLFVLSMALGYVYERSGSLWTSILMHAAFNGLNVVMVMAGWVERT